MDVNILECTLRDGSYAVDFRFTLGDTALLCQFLSSLGFRFIEIGHGLGIGGKMLVTEEELLQVAKSKAPSSRVGMFCIPGIATVERLKALSKEGLDFVRIGSDPSSLEKVFPFIECARSAGLLTMVNIMKSYTVPAEKFAEGARAVEKAGGEVIYIVDSAGGMLPEEIDEYFGAVKNASDIQLGFHGHNNLHLATANTLQAIRSGAAFVDTTLHGIGRNVGNAPTEVILAILQKCGIDSGIDLFQLMDGIEQWIHPMMRRAEPYDMLSVVMGYAKFHSSFLPKVKALAGRYGVDPRDLILKAAELDCERLHEKDLEAYAREAPKRKSQTGEEGLLNFSSATIRRETLSTTLRAVTELTEELKNVSMKKRVRVVIELSKMRKNDDLLLSEYVTTDEEMVMGRIHYGSTPLLSELLPLLKDSADFLLWNTDPSHDDTLVLKWFEQRRIFYDDLVKLRANYVSHLLYSFQKRVRYKAMFISGGEEKEVAIIAEHLSPLFDSLFIGRLPEDDICHSEIELFLCLATLSDEQANQMMNDLKKRFSKLSQLISYSSLNISQMYHHQFKRWFHAARAL